MVRKKLTKKLTKNTKNKRNVQDSVQDKTQNTQQPPVIQFSIQNPELKEFFKTPEVTAETLQHLKKLAQSPGWRVIQAFLEEQQRTIAKTLLSIAPNDALTIAILQSQNRITEELKHLPETLTEIVQKNTTESFDPY